MNDYQLIVLLMGMTFIGYIVYDVLFDKKTSTVAQPRQTLPINFELDIKALEIIITENITFSLFNMRLSNKHLLNDLDCKDIINDIFSNTVSTISEEYKGILLRYFDEEGLNEYIARKITVLVVNETLQYNRKRLGKI
jgi:hypothetical protein